MFGLKVYDLSGWIHPGGTYLIQKSYGKEISRYLYGAYSIEGSKRPPYSHSAHAFNLLE